MEKVQDDVENLGQVYLAGVMEKWDEAYSLFEELEYAGKREFFRGGKPENSMEIYDEMMQIAKTAFSKDSNYELSVEETTNAFIYVSNGEVSAEEFRKAVTSVLEGDKKWKDFAEGTV